MRRKHRRLQGEADLDITAFMNLMIVLVPVLLISAVFTQTSIVGLNFPKQVDGKSMDSKNLQLRVALYAHQIQVSDNQHGLIKAIPDVEGHHDYKVLRNLLEAIKQKVPDKRDIVLLARPDTPYQTLITAMDDIRSYPAVVAASLVRAELFPDISLGDAPALQSLPTDGSNGQGGGS